MLRKIHHQDSGAFQELLYVETLFVLFSIFYIGFVANFTRVKL